MSGTESEADRTEGGRVARTLAQTAPAMAARPLLFAALGVLVCLMASIGLLRWSVDPGQDLLVGKNSPVGQTNAQYNAAFGADPMVVVFTAKSPSAFYLEKNLAKFTALEDDLANNPDVASVLGPGTIASSSIKAAQAFSDRVSTEYPLFVAEDLVTSAIQKGETDQSKLTQVYNDGYALAQRELAVDVIDATAQSELAREKANAAPAGSQRYLDAGEQAADAAAGASMPALFPQYLAGPTGTPDTASAQTIFGRITAAYGLCDQQVAIVLKVSPTCQTFFERALLDLPHCPTYQQLQQGGATFCPPKPQWSAVFPSNGEQEAVVTVRLTAAAAADPRRARAVRDHITALLRNGVGGISGDAYLDGLKNGTLDQSKFGQPANQQAIYKSASALSALQPTECGGDTKTPGCASYGGDAAIGYKLASASLLGGAVADSMTRALAVPILPLAVLLMVVILGTAFKVRRGSRILPLLSSGLATAAVVGFSLTAGTSLTPATLAAIPILAGLGVDYAVQVVARYEEQIRDADRETALRHVLSHTGPATGAAALATIAGVAALAVVTGIDGGGLTAVPLIAEFAIVVLGGVLISWFASVFIALPLAVVTSDNAAAAGPAEPVEIAEARRTTSLSRGGALQSLLVIAVVTSLVGWAVLPRIPVETDPQRLLAPDLQELHDLRDVQNLTGYSDEVDIYVTGQVAGPYQTAADVPLNVVWLCQAGDDIISRYGSQLATVTSIADILSANATSANGTQQCTPSAAPAPAPGGTPSPSAAPAAPTSSPSAERTGIAHLAGSRVQDAAPASPSASAGGGSAAASAAPSPAPSSPSAPPQSAFLCDLRALPRLTRALVMPIANEESPCPSIDKFRGVFVTPDNSAINPTSTRIALGVSNNVTTVTQEATLIDSLRSDVSSPPNGLHATPAGLPVAVASAYDTITNRVYLFNLAPLAVVGILLLLMYREPRRALLPLLPTALAAGWSPLIVWLLGRLPGSAGTTLGSFSPLTVVMGALVIALATEFGVVLLSRFIEARREGATAEDAAAITLASVGRSVIISAATLAAGFLVLALTGFLPGGMPMLGSFGIAVLIDLGLAVVAVFVVMLPAAVALERSSPRWDGVEAEPGMRR